MATNPGQIPMVGVPVTQQPGMPVTQQPGMPVTQQPGMPPMPPGFTPPQPNWMPTANVITGVPAGLEYLAQIDQLIIKQKVELLEMLSGFETNNKYQIKNSLGQDVYKAVERSGFCIKQCCGNNRKFKMSITDNSNREVLLLNRPFNFNAPCFCCPCCQHEIDVTSPITGEKLGHIKQTWHPTHPRLTVYDANMQEVFKIEGPCCGCNFCSDVNFSVKDLNGTEIGVVQKQWTGCFKEMITDADNFSITFPLDLDVKLKAVLLGAVFLIDFMYFEDNQTNQSGLID